MPWGGLLFLASLIISGILVGLNHFGLYIFGYMDFVWAFLDISWKVYIGVAVFTLWIMVTFSFQHCCIEMNTFKNHMIHYGTRHIESLLVAVLWPYAIFTFDQNMRVWVMSWLDVVGNAIEYWIPLGWLDDHPEGIPMTTVDMQTGETETIYTSSAEERQQAMADFVTKTVDR
jgi:hypothetical protein